MSYQFDKSQMVARMVWLDKVNGLPNTKIDATAKLVVFAISRDFARRGVPHTQLSKIWRTNLADYSGLSEGTVSKKLVFLAGIGAIQKENKSERRAKDGATITPIWVCFTSQFYPEILLPITDMEKSNHGGDRIRYHKGCDGIIVNLCTGCGETNVPESEVYYGDEVEPEQDELAQLDSRARDYEATATLAEMPRDGQGIEREREAARRAMKAAQGAGEWKKF